MTAPGPVEPAPGSAAFARRPGGVTWALSLIGLLAALLVALPCAGSALAAVPPAPGSAAGSPAAGTTPGTAGSRTARSTVAQSSAARSTVTQSAPAAAPARTLSVPFEKAWCSKEAPLPGPGHGCSGDSWCGRQAQLPNAPPQPVAAALPRLVPPRPAPVAVPVIAAAWPAPTPDLHLLQVNRP
ncbi:hypothetical protein [Kitasatospora acidiphila]|uniref:hypothetical protein n=1 Tax=Kitasatospora acidiphila TaxID=2567942 RepID=UPI0015F0DB54|nr:hypothetical protein [Kitasatospora acidiphila]